MKLSGRELILVTLLLLTLAVSALHMLVWQPLLNTRDTLSGEVAGLRSTVMRLEMAQEREAEIQARIATLKEEIFVATIERRPGIPLPDTLVLLENTARTAGVRLDSTGIQQAEFGGSLGLQVAGTYFNIYRFMTLLEARDDAITLLNIQFGGAGEAMSASLQLTMFSSAIPGLPQEGGFPDRSPFVPRR